jgi:hypothetical protein
MSVALNRSAKPLAAVLLIHRQQEVEQGVVVLDTEAWAFAGFDDLPHETDHRLRWGQSMPSRELLPHRLVPLRIHDAQGLDRQRFRAVERRRVDASDPVLAYCRA